MENKCYYIDLENFYRKEQFEYFRGMGQPYAGVTVEVDITNLRKRQKAEGWPFFLTILYVAGTAANRIPELRQRIRGEDIVEYEQCGTSHTVARENGGYCYCRIQGGLPFEEYLPLAKKAHQTAKVCGTMEEGDTESLFFVSSLPGLSYTALIQPTPFPVDSNPRITFGGYHYAGGQLLLPVSLLVNHALADGIHITRFYEEWESVASDLVNR